MTDKLDKLGSLSRKAVRDRMPSDPDAREAQFRAWWASLVENPNAARNLGTEPPAEGIALARQGDLRYWGGLLEAESFWSVLS